MTISIEAGRLDWIEQEGSQELPEGRPGNRRRSALLCPKRQKHPTAKPLKGFGGASVLEVVEDNVGDTYRAVYTVRYEEAIYVLHCFQKKSKQGIATPQNELDLVERRLKVAEG